MKMRRIPILGHKRELWVLGMTVATEVNKRLDDICPKWIEANTPRRGDDWWIETKCKKNCSKCTGVLKKYRKLIKA